MVAAVLEAGAGRLAPDDVSEALADPAGFLAAVPARRTWTPAPAHGLHLHSILYPPHAEGTRLMHEQTWRSHGAADEVDAVAYVTTLHTYS